MPHNISEDRTRKELIDPQLEKAGWYLRDHSRVKTEIPVDGYDAEPWNGVTDYTLYRENGEVLAVVEAKEAKTSALGTWAMHRAAVPGADAVCLRTDDIDEVSERLDLQTMNMSRVTPDGVILDWRLAGLKQALSNGVPFFIQWDIPDDLHPGRVQVEHQAGPVGLGSVTIAGDIEQLGRWVEGVPGLELRSGDPAVSFELSARRP